MRHVLPILLVAAPMAAQAPALPPSPLSAREKAAHLLDRLSFGPRPGEVDALSKGGDTAIAAWLQAQLHPAPEPALGPVSAKAAIFPPVATAGR